ncbi:ATP-binding cassette domain-containing protein [Tenacibaculum dicentrarchi]|uniref:ATP-binding cassette domain-containing protein n=1 Tax=Tenacibaculum dicentrarchi TaxID=669041 RepID=UPI003519CCA8
MVEINNLLVNIDGFIKGYKDIYVEKGSVLMITGENGSGKTILLNAICGLIDYKKGAIFLNKINTKNDIWKEFTACFLGKDFLIPYLTAREYFELCLLLAKKEVKNTKYIDEYSKKLLFNDLNKKIKNLSLGNQKKVGLISTLITNPEIIIWDEPFANLDENTCVILNEIISKLSFSGKTIIYTNHHKELSFHNIEYNIDNEIID